uniref:Uncharacterized protein n=1 Tax=Anguilla anguilla TaxID=7936 RepID=A0A0E9SVZ7_ANGAN
MHDSDHLVLCLGCILPQISLTALHPNVLICKASGCRRAVPCN